MPISVRDSRHTRQRRRILAALKLSSSALTAEEVYRVARRQLGRVSVSTVYRNLDVLARRGEIFRLTCPDGVSRFAGTVQPLTFFSCLSCGQTEARTVVASVPFFQKHFPKQRVMTASATLQGWCADCLSRKRRHA